MADTAPGEITKTPDGGTIRFVRTYRHPIEKVWAALTERDRLAEWLAPAEIELRQGGSVSIPFANTDTTIESTVVEIDPPRLLSYRWMQGGNDWGLVRWELAPAGEATTLTLIHSQVAGDDGIAEYGAGWHTHLDMLARALDTGPVEFPWPEWDANFARYYELLGLEPAETS